MITAGVDEVSRILHRVRSWPAPSRLLLARLILESLEGLAISDDRPASPVDKTPRGVPVDSIVGLLGTGQAPPGDEDCRQIVEEERWKKYGP